MNDEKKVAVESSEKRDNYWVIVDWCECWWQLNPKCKRCDLIVIELLLWNAEKSLLCIWTQRANSDKMCECVSIFWTFQLFFYYMRSFRVYCLNDDRLLVASHMNVIMTGWKKSSLCVRIALESTTTPTISNACALNIRVNEPHKNFSIRKIVTSFFSIVTFAGMRKIHKEKRRKKKQISIKKEYCNCIVVRQPCVENLKKRDIKKGTKDEDKTNKKKKKQKQQNRHTQQIRRVDGFSVCVEE